MAGTVVADTLQADSTSTLVLKNGVANTPPTIQDSAGTQIGTFCRAWINFDGAAVTNPASMTGVRGSFNVSSVLDNGAGDHTINFTTAMSDANYATVGTVSATSTTAASPALSLNVYGGQTGQSTSSVRVIQEVSTGAANDRNLFCVAIFR
jgi:hypothetical protein